MGAEVGGSPLRERREESGEMTYKGFPLDRTLRGPLKADGNGSGVLISPIDR